MYGIETQGTPTVNETLQVSNELCPTRQASKLLGLAGDFLALTRPRVLMLVLFTAPAGMAMGGFRIGLYKCVGFLAFIESFPDSFCKRRQGR